MKGGSDIKKVILKFIGTGINDIMQACVTIYDECGNIIYQGETYNGILSLYLADNEVYKVIALSGGEIIKNYFYVSDNYEKYTFYFYRSLLRTITFLLTDANYGNLPIEKGEIVLCQK